MSADPITWAERDALRVTRDGAWYVMSDCSVDDTPVSPALATREQALDLRDAILALADSDPARYRRIIQGHVPPPGAEWLIGGGTEPRGETS